MSPDATIIDKHDQRILIAEDEPMLAFALEDLLIESGFEIAGVTGELATAIAIIESGVCDAAILDANLSGVSAVPAASALSSRGLPFLILSGYSSDQQPSAFSGVPRLQKPCRPERLILALRGILPEGARHRPGQSS
jgi:DNA-binding response OmpR family regulator